MTILGYLLGGIPVVQRHFEKFVLLVILVSVAPLIVHGIRARLAGPATLPPRPSPRPELP
jgi:membrane protein DedA with SNARE-associated domain